MKGLPNRRMQEHPDLEQLKRQAKELLRSFAARNADAVTEVNAHYRGADATQFALHDAQLVLARSYGFDSWPKLKAYVDGITIRRLADAVRANDLAQVRAMLRTRPELADMAMSYGDEHRPIHFAVTGRLPGMVRLLMKHGANARAGIHPHRAATKAWTLAKERGYDEIVGIIEEEESRREVPDESPEPDPLRGDEDLRAAVVSGDVKFVLTRQAEGNLANPIRWDSGGLLSLAVQSDRMDVLRLLLDFGFDPNEHVISGEGDWIAHSQGYPLWDCAARGKREMAQLLLDRGADPNVHVDSSGSSVYSAYSHKQWDMVELLRANGGVVTADIAAIYRQTDVARTMLADGTGAPAELLHFGASGGAAEIVRMSLARLDWPYDDDRWFRELTEPLSFWHHIPWLYAGEKSFSREGYLACFRSILERCNPNVPGSFGRTPLHEVAAMGDWVTDEEVLPFAETLLNAGARVGLLDDILNSTSLGWACRWGRAGVVRELLEHGADAIEADAEPWARPRAWAEKMGHSAIVEILASYGG